MLVITVPRKMQGTAVVSRGYGHLGAVIVAQERAPSRKEVGARLCPLYGPHIVQSLRNKESVRPFKRGRVRTGGSSSR